MAFRKFAHFSDVEVGLAHFAKAMSHPARVRIVALLLAHGGRMNCGSLAGQLPLAQSTVSQHLKELVNAGILSVIQEGTSCFYELQRDELRHFCSSFQIAMGNKQ